MHHYTDSPHKNRAIARQIVFKYYDGKLPARWPLAFVVGRQRPPTAGNQFGQPAIVCGSRDGRYPVSRMHALSNSLRIATHPIATASILDELCSLVYISAAVGDAIVLQGIGGI